MMIAPVVVELDEADELYSNALVLQPPRLPVQRYVHLPAVQKTRQNTCKLIASSCSEYLVRGYRAYQIIMFTLITVY